MQTAPKLILIGCWAVLMLVWAVMALRAEKDAYAQSTKERESYSAAFVASLFCLVLPLRAPPGLDDGPIRALYLPLVTMSPGLGWASALVAVAGLAIAIWARLSLGRNWSAAVALKDGHELVTDGPYALVRHPIYTALLLLVLATVMANRTPFALAGLLLMILSCWIKLRAEEELMTMQFPESYPAYMARTKRLIPALI